MLFRVTVTAAREIEELLMPALPPPARADRAWLAAVLGAHAKTLRVRRLDGGITSAVHDVAILDANGKPRRYVLRRYTGADRESPVDDVRREEAILIRARHVWAPGASPHRFRCRG
jgi:hypothetical protein